MLSNSIEENINQTAKRASSLNKKANLAQTQDSEEFSLILDKEIIKAREEGLDQDKEFYKQKAKLKNKESNPIVVPGQIIAHQELGATKLNDRKKTDELKVKNKNIKLTSVNGSENISIEEEAPAWANVVKVAAKKLTEDLELTSLILTDRTNTKLESLIKNKDLSQVVQIEFKDLFAELVKEVKVRKDGELTKLKIGLEPERLGKIDVYFILDKNKLHISIAANDETRQLIENNESELRNLLNNNGYSLADLSFGSFGQKNIPYAWDKPNSSGQVKNEQETLNILPNKDIIPQVEQFLTNVIINYIA